MSVLENQALLTSKKQNSDNIKHSLTKQIFEKRNKMDLDKKHWKGYVDKCLNFSSYNKAGWCACSKCSIALPKRFLGNNSDVLLTSKSNKFR